MCGTQGAATGSGPGELLRSVWSGDTEQAVAAWRELGRRAARDCAALRAAGQLADASESGWARRLVLDVAEGKLSLPPEAAIPGLRELADHAPEHVWSLIRTKDDAGASIAGAALGQGGSRFQQELILLTSDREVSAQLAGIAGLAELAAKGSAEAVDALGGCLHSPHGQARWAGAAALGRARGRGGVERAFALLEGVAGDGDERVVSGAAFGAAGLWPASHQRAVALVRSILARGPAGIRAATLAMQGLPRRAGERMVRNCPAEPGGEVCAFCAPALAKWAQEGSTLARRKLHTLTRSIHPSVRAAAAEFIAAACRAGIPMLAEPQDTLLRLASDPSALVRAALAQGLASCLESQTPWGAGVPMPAEARDILVRLAKDRAGSVRVQAVLALGDLGDKQMVRRAALDRDPGVRAAAAAGLDPRVAGDGDRLLRLSHDAHPEVASAAARSLGRAGAGLSGPGWDGLMELACEPGTRRAAAEAMAAVFDSDPEAILGIGYWYPVKQLGAAVLHLIARAARDRVVAEVARTRARMMEERENLAEATEDAAVLAAALDREDDLDRFTWAVRCLRAATVEDIGAAAADASALNMHLARPLVAAGLAVGRALRARSAQARERYLGQAAARLEIALQEEPLVLEAVVPHRVAIGWRAVVELARMSPRAAHIEVTVSASRLAGQSQGVAVLQIANTGESAAQEVVVAAHGNERVVGHLPPGTSEEVLIPFEVAGPGPLPIVGEVRFHDGAGESACPFEGASEEIANGSLASLENPYVVGKPLPGASAMFFGRAAEIAFVERALASGETGSVVVLSGARRTGKTSLLKRLADHLSATYRTVFVDLQGLVVFDTDDLFRGLAHEVRRRDAPPWMEPGPGSPTRQSRDGDGATSGAEWVQEEAARYGQRVVLLVDELDHLEEELQAGHLGPEVFGHLRHLIQHSENVGFVLCGSLRMAELAGEHWSFLLNLAAHRQIGPLTREEAEDLVRTPLGRLGIVCEDAAVALAVRLAGRHPYFLQLLGYELVERCVESGVGGLTVSLVERAADEVTAVGEVHLRYLWDTAHRHGQAALQALATAQGWVSTQELTEMTGMSQEQTSTALQELVRTNTVAEASGWYKLDIGLLGRWLVARPPWGGRHGGPQGLATGRRL